VISEKHSGCEEKPVSVEVEASSLLREIVAPQQPGESVKALIGRAARRTGIEFGRVKRLWYSEAKAILASEMDAIRSAAARKACEASSDLRSQHQDVARRIAELEKLVLDLGAKLDRSLPHVASGQHDAPGARAVREVQAPRM